MGEMRGQGMVKALLSFPVVIAKACEFASPKLNFASKYNDLVHAMDDLEVPIEAKRMHMLRFEAALNRCLRQSKLSIQDRRELLDVRDNYERARNAFEREVRHV
jgi:hypothetical protein